MTLSRRNFLAAGAGLAVALAGGSVSPSFAAGDKPKIGVTLHPYYSFVANIVGDLAEVVPLISPEANPHGYQPQPDDIIRATSLDVLVVNGIGHDEWAFEIIASAGRKDDLPLIYANATVALIPVSGAGDERIVNPHTFVSTTASIQQIYEIAARLGELFPDDASTFRGNARAFAARIRTLRAEFLQKIADLPKDKFKAATMHAGYDYMFQEMGLTIAAVVEPKHGVDPTARQLAETIEAIRKADVTSLFTEEYFASALSDTVQRETGVRVYTLSHMSEGPMTPEKYEVEMRQNLETLVQAIKDSSEL